MAHEYTTWAYSNDMQPAGRKFVLVALADSANADGHSFPGQKRLAHLTGQSERSVRGHLDWLEQHGYIKRQERRRKDGTRTSDAYWLPNMSATGDICRWPLPATLSKVTGNSLQSHRQISPKSPAESAGHELPEEPSVEPSVKPTSSRDDEPSEPGTSIEVGTPTPRANPTDLQDLVDTWNEHRGSLPAAQKLTSTRRSKLRALTRDLGGHDQAKAAIAIATKEVSGDPWWQKHGYGLDNLLAGQKVIQKAETAWNRGTFDQQQSEINRMLAALGPN